MEKEPFGILIQSQEDIDMLYKLGDYKNSQEISCNRIREVCKIINPKNHVVCFHMYHYSKAGIEHTSEGYFRDKFPQLELFNFKVNKLEIYNSFQFIQPFEKVFDSFEIGIANIKKEIGL
jgi:hypothetical protein